MGVYIADIKMPQHCAECQFIKNDKVFHNCYCEINKKHMEYPYNVSRAEHCPLIEIKTPHGDLVDTKNLKKKMNYYGFKAVDMTVHEFIEYELKVVIKAEE